MAEAESDECALSISSVKSWILDTILDFPETSDWSGGPYTPFKLVDVPSTSPEFMRVETHFKRSVYATSILKIQRVENPFLLAEFLMKKQKMGDSVQIKHLFHGTKRTNIDPICKDNFNWRLRGCSRGHKFGQGTSFARDAYYATHYTQGSNTMIYSRVLVNRSTIGCSTTKIPPQPFDTTQNAQGTVIVKYEDDDYYPDYIIHHGTVPKIQRSYPIVNLDFDDLDDLFDNLMLM